MNNMKTMQGCCCEPPDSCNLSGVRPQSIQLTLPSQCSNHQGTHLLTNGGTYAQMSNVTGVVLEGGDPEELARYCWCWWLATGITSNEWYIVPIINGVGSPSTIATTAVFIYEVGTPANIENWAPSPQFSTWNALDGLPINWFLQGGVSQCTGTPSPAILNIPPS